MTARPANELLYDSEAALRLVDSAIEDLRGADSRETTVPVDPAQLLARGYSETVSVLGSLRESRDVLQKSGLETAHHPCQRTLDGTNAEMITRRLDYASSVLAEIESRLAGLARLLDPAAFHLTRPPAR